MNNFCFSERYEQIVKIKDKGNAKFQEGILNEAKNFYQKSLLIQAQLPKALLNACSPEEKQLLSKLKEDLSGNLAQCLIKEGKLQEALNALGDCQIEKEKNIYRKLTCLMEL